MFPACTPSYNPDNLQLRVHNPVEEVIARLQFDLVPVQQSIWTYNFGSTRFLYYLTFQEGKLIDITTGEYGH